MTQKQRVASKIDPNWLRPSMHPAYPRLMCAQLHRRGVSMGELFRGNSLSWEDMQGRSRFISYEQFRRLILNAIELTGCPWLALEMSSILKVSAHGPLGYGALAAPTLGDAFALIQRAIPIRQKIYQFDAERRDEEHVTFILRERFDTRDLHEFFYVALFGSLLDLLETAIGTSAPGLRVGFDFAAPPWIERYHQHFPDIDIHFGAAETTIQLPLSLLEMKCLTADDYAWRNAVRECDQLLAQHDGGEDLAAAIKTSLFELGAPYPDLEQMAAQHHVSVRTLIRHLKKEDTSYQTLLDEVRQELACWHLQNSDLRIEEIAELLGFVDTSNFSRVFRRWFGKTPSEFRGV